MKREKKHKSLSIKKVSKLLTISHIIYIILVSVFLIELLIIIKGKISENKTVNQQQKEYDPGYYLALTPPLSPTALPTPNLTPILLNKFDSQPNNWSCYTNDKDNFQYCYPPDWINYPPCSYYPSPGYCDGAQNEFMVKPKNAPNDPSGRFIVFMADDYDCKKTIKEIKSSWKGATFKENRTYINNVLTPIYEWTFENTDKNYVVLKTVVKPNNNTCLRLSLYSNKNDQNQEKILNQILFSFKFLK